MSQAIKRICDECGRCTADGAPGDAGSEHAHLWYCLECWHAWDMADGQLPRYGADVELPVAPPEFLVSYEPPEGLPDVTLLQGAAQRIVAIPDSAARQEAVQTVFKLLDAIIAAPEDVKKRTVKKTNAAFHKKVGRHRAAVDFLRGAGFTEADDVEAEAAQPGSGRDALLSMPVAFIMRLTDAHHILARVVADAGLKAPALPQSMGSSGIFNPSQSNQQVTGVAPLKKAPVDGKSEADRLREEARAKERVLQERAYAEPVPLRPAAFWLSAGRRLEDVIRETLQDGAGSGPEGTDGARPLEPSRSRAYGLCVLRVVCPDKAVLQAHFRAGDQGEYVLTQIAPLLSPHVRGAAWYVYQTPPLRRLAPKESLAAAGLAPGASLYLGFEGERPGPPYLEAGLARQLGPAPQEDQRGASGASTQPPEREARRPVATAALRSAQSDCWGEE
uniref:PUB domain-containing protein n=1 Tax=Pyrodinium bahamense TaxID=73915 RepID=A0A7S0FWY9_9DINO|mmetsp:Transcript_52256/g.144708  ORF Transcript_52256/g.144708 Transcript_52256/m.144708 type:complete len:446 (+) Transcript_52256:163-1500(+)